MKKLFSMAILVALFATPAMAATTIVNSKHDMIASGHATVADGASAEVCIFCHTPHGAQSSSIVPLWNNTPIDAVSYYGATAAPGSKINFTTSELLINATDARICLACHDGGVSPPINGPNVGVIDVEIVTTMTTTLLGSNMSNDHPIGMDLGTAPNSQDPSIRTIAAINTNFGGVDPFFGGNPRDTNFNYMWCSSCHDVHDSDPLKKPFLRKSNVNSALCKACHIK